MQISQLDRTLKGNSITIEDVYDVRWFHTEIRWYSCIIRIVVWQ